MKVAILQWIYDSRDVGTIERISTTGADCCRFLQRQMEGFFLNEFKAGEMPIGDPTLYPWYLPNSVITTMSELQQWIQNHLDNDELGTIRVLGTRNGESYEDHHHWWRIQVRNLH